MENNLKIFLDQLQNDKSYVFEGEITQENFLAEAEDELIFEKPFKIKLKAYLVDKLLILNADVKFYFKIPCAICNEFVEKEIYLKNIYITKDVKEISLAYDAKIDLKNACFIEIPSFVECLDNCPSRKDIKKYLKKNDNKHYPFSKIEE